MKIGKIPAIIMAIVVLALISLYAVPTSVYSSSTINKALSDTTDTKAYVCPMHPEVTSDKPGDCPKCGMALVLKTDENKDMTMKCMNMEKCKEMGCDMDKCKGETGGCSSECMDKCKEHKDMNMKDKNSKKECPMMKDKKDMKMDGGDCKSKCDHK